MNLCPVPDGDYFFDKTAVVTGAASGVGLALSEQLLQYGARSVLMADFNRENLQREYQRLLEVFPEKVFMSVCNVTAESEIQQMIAYAVSTAGRIDLLFNNAGAGFAGAFEKTTNEDWKRAFDLNFYGALYGVRAVLPVMMRQGSGQIVNIISGIAFCPMPLQSMYSATKAALNGMTLALRAEYEFYNIKISSATPGTTRSAIWAGGTVPEQAQSAADSAIHILTGVVHNERIITGDGTDRESAAHCFDPDYASAYDEYVRNIATRRREGDLNAL
ncbi:MAG: SDR family oxidoreductase [Planctomycetia bacterium]|nr:SDR family oxidoreductase [Planctomycetia bacterium]